MSEKFEMRPYGKGELAEKYTHGCRSTKQSLVWLNNELKLYPGLMEKLTVLGYRPTQRQFTIAQLRVIVEAIGEP